MSLHAKRFGFPSTPKGQAGLSHGRGYALLVVMIMATVLLISLTAALPSIYTAGQREREEELIFRGNEYARAIALFRRQFGRFPVSVDELLKTSGIRFLRRAYRDPMSRSGTWRFIHADPNGILIDSRKQGPFAQRTAEKPQGSSLGSTQETPHASALLEQGKETRGAFIAGVASSSGRESIRVWHGSTRYDEWEFLGTSFEQAGAGGTIPGQLPSLGQPGLQIPSIPPLTEGPVHPQ